MAARKGTPFIYMVGHYLLLSSCGFLSRPNCAARVFAGGIPQVCRGVREYTASTVRSANQWRPSPQRRRLSDPLRPPQMTEALHGKPEASRYSGRRTCSLPVLSGSGTENLNPGVVPEPCSGASATRLSPNPQNQRPT